VDYFNNDMSANCYSLQLPVAPSFRVGELLIA